MSTFKGRKVTQEFGVKNKWEPGGHTGIDLAYRLNERVKAFKGGKVISKFYDSVGGKVVLIKTADGYEQWYGHLNRFSNIKVGSKINVGTVVGGAGQTGTATGVHLHYGIRDNKGKWVNPRDYYMKKRTILQVTKDALSKVRGERDELKARNRLLERALELARSALNKLRRKK